MVEKMWKEFCREFFTIKTFRILISSLFVALSIVLFVFTKIPDWIAILIFIFWFFLFRLVQELVTEVEKEKEQKGNELPKMKKRFTHRMDDGSIGVKQSEMEEAIGFLYCLENYIYKI